MKYNISPFYYQRLKTREVNVGSVRIGGNNPIRIQSMTTSSTKDTKETVRQVVELAEAGCEIVRITVPSLPDAENMPNIRKELARLNCKVPIVADIHFTPSLAMMIVDHVEKVRINPGNFADKKKFAVIEYTDKEYNEELERISDVFLPLVRKCKTLGVAMRIGTNHGSLSDRIMNRFGDTPAGMCESALEFIRMAESENYRDIVVSMKSSNPVVMVNAYRLLCSRFLELGLDYPIHLGVTEAGDGKDGRIKSSIGIGSLLEEGIGDTIRVSLTEDAIHEIPVAKRLVAKYNLLREANSNSISAGINSIYKEFRNPYNYERFYSSAIPAGDLRLGENFPIRVETVLHSDYFNSDSITSLIETQKKSNENVGFEIFSFKAKNQIDVNRFLLLAKQLKNPLSIDFTGYENNFLELSDLLFDFHKIQINPFAVNFESKEFQDFLKKTDSKNKTIEFTIFPEDLEKLPSLLDLLSRVKFKNGIFSTGTSSLLYDYRKLAFHLQNTEFPILLNGNFTDSESALYDASTGIGGLLIDGIGDCIRLDAANTSPAEMLNLSFDILQATRLRTTRTEYISCPSCGRTLFNLQDTTLRIKKRTGHLTGVKIAVMGCIVNGPGEMADADFGYVGAGPGKVHLYRGKEIVAKFIPDEIADEKLVELIQQAGMWREP